VGNVLGSTLHPLSEAEWGLGAKHPKQGETHATPQFIAEGSWVKIFVRIRRWSHQEGVVGISQASFRGLFEMTNCARDVFKSTLTSQGKINFVAFPQQL
jgi:hypothetical protein